MNWKELARPISQGSWGIKHLPSFSLALRLKIFWLVLNNSGIWNKLISVKYLKNRPVHIWLREKRFVVQNASILWRGFVETLPWLGKGLIWNVGNGSLIRVGVDPMVGFGTDYILPVGLREYLEDFGIVTLNQARNITSSASSYWYTAVDLDLCNDWKLLWERYIRGLEYGRIFLSDLNDTLLCSHSNFVGSLSAAKGYDNISSSCLESPDLSLEFLWHQRIPLKIICFTWLVIKGCILTWDQLQRKCFQGPSKCILCGSNSEDIPHLFLYCPTSLRTFSYFADKFGVVFPTHDSVYSLLTQWFNSPSSKAAYRYLPFFILWIIWNLRNKCIFENWKPALPALFIRIEGLLNTYPAPTKYLKIRNVGSKPALTFPCGFFDGASAAN